MLQISEVYVNDTEHCGIGESGWYEPFTSDRGKLYRSLVKEYGKASKMYLDRKVPVDTDPTLPAYRLIAEPCGWVFTKRVAYDDDKAKTFLRSVWVTLREIDSEGKAE